MTEGRAVNPLLISCSVTAVVSYVALVYLVTMGRSGPVDAWGCRASLRFCKPFERSTKAFERLSDFLPENEFLEYRLGWQGSGLVDLDSVQAIPFSGVTNPRYRSRRGREGGYAAVC